MNSISIAASPKQTPLTVWLASVASHVETRVYNGAITPFMLDAASGEIEALLTGAAVHDLGWLHRVQVRGEDRFRWLNGMVTNAVSDLPAHTGAWNLALNAQGRILGDLMVWRETTDGESGHDALELVTAADQAERLLAHLDRFIIMDDVELAPQDDKTALGLTGPKAGEVLERLGIAKLAEPLTQARVAWNGIELLLRRAYGVLGEHNEIWAPAEYAGQLWQALKGAGAIPAGSGALESYRVVEGIPAYGVDILEKDLPQETSQLRALCFSKGCYLGQEIVERIRSRGNVHRHLRSLEVNGPLPAPGTELMLEGNAVGQVTSATEIPFAGNPRCFALGMLRAEAEVRNEPLIYSAGGASGRAMLLSAPPVL